MKKISGITLLTALILTLALPDNTQASDVYVSLGDTVYRIDQSGNSSVLAAGLVGGASGLALATSGELYVKSTDTIHRITTNGAVSTFVQDGLLNGGGALAFDSAGNLYAANGGITNVVKITPVGEVSIYAPSTLFGSNVDHMAGLAFDSLNNLYISTWNDRSVLKIEPNGSSSIFYQDTSVVTAGLAFDNAGNLFVANFIGASVVKITAEGVASPFALGNGLEGPWGLAADQDNNLYSANYPAVGNNAVLEIDSTGNVSTFAAGVGGNGGGLSYVAAVPEPSTYALLLLSGAASLWALRRRKS